MTEEHGVPIVRACQATRLSRAAYYRPGIDRAARDAEVITALQAIVIKEQRWGFWKCHDRLRAQGYGWNHKRIWRVYANYVSTCRAEPSDGCRSANDSRCWSSRA